MAEASIPHKELAGKRWQQRTDAERKGGTGTWGDRHLVTDGQMVADYILYYLLHPVNQLLTLWW